MNGDLYAFENSKLGNPQIENPVEKKNVVEINDSNTGNYNSNILRYDLSSLYNQNLFIDWDSPASYLAIPIVTVLTLKDTASKGTASAQNHSFTAGQNNYALGYKNGFYQLIDNVSLKCGNNQLSSGNNNLNVLNNFKNLTVYSRDMLENADIYGFSPDNHESWNYTKVDNTEGTINNSCLKNNKIRQEILGMNLNRNTLGDITTSEKAINALFGNNGKIDDFNSGFYQRIKRLNGNFQGSGTKNNLGAGTLITSSNDTTYDTVLQDGLYNLVYNNMFFIKMSDISHFFKQVGYSRFYATLEIQLNIGSCDINFSNAIPTDSTIDSITSSFQKGTCPFMISKIGDGLNLTVGSSVVKTTTLTIQNGIAKVGNYSHPYSNSTIFCQTVQLKANYENMLLNNKMKQIVYEDFYQADISIKSQASFNFIATNGIANLKAILLVPFLASDNNLLLSPLLSPLTSEPGTTSPLINISNLQVLLAGERILSNEIKYNFKNFLENIYGCRSVNGGRSPELNNSLITYNMFMNNYRYMYFDVSHIDNSTPKAITVQGKNDNNVVVQLMVFAIYEKKVNLDIASGALSVE